jgi:hypothetical protein
MTAAPAPTAMPADSCGIILAIKLYCGFARPSYELSAANSHGAYEREKAIADGPKSAFCAGSFAKPCEYRACVRNGGWVLR